MNNNKTIKILHLNCRSVKDKSKQIEIEYLAKTHQIDIMTLNETFLKPIDQFYIPDFHTIRNDRLNKKGGGSAILIRKSIEFKKIILNSENECLGIMVNINPNTNLAIFNIYIAPSSNLDQDLFSKITKNYTNFLVNGDLNAKNKLWNCNNENKNGKSLSRIIENSNICILNNMIPTYRPSNSVLELSICSNPVK